MKKHLPYTFFLLAMLLSFADAAGQATFKFKQESSFRIVFYNVENLFDTIDDPHTNDQEFLPSGKNQWTSSRYEKKLDRLSEALAGLKSGQMPAVIGLCEVENRVVVEQLALQPRLKKAGYSIIHHESPDERGIDNAMLYDARLFKVIAHRAIRVDLSGFSDRTRDILYVKGIPAKAKKDTLHLFINHWPSRSGGKEKSEPRRLVAAKTLLQAVDSIFRINPSASIVIMGDFNDEPSDASVSQALGATEPGGFRPSGLYNLMTEDFRKGKGTIFWNDWDMFDQFIVSGQLILNKKGLSVTQTRGGIFDPEWLMFRTNQGELRPNRTLGREYYGGYSDHLPVYIELNLD